MFKDALKNLRKKNNISQKRLAEELYVSQQTVAKWETDRSTPNPEMLVKLANYFGVSTDYILDNDDLKFSNKKNILVPVLGKVIAGIPIEAVEEILDYEEISKDMSSQGEHFALQIKGDSMEPRMKEGDVIIVRKQSDVDTGDIAVVSVNGDEATVKKIKKRQDGLELIPNNPAYDIMFYSNADIELTPVSIIGKVVELRAKFK